MSVALAGALAAALAAALAILSEIISWLMIDSLFILPLFSLWKVNKTDKWSDLSCKEHCWLKLLAKLN